MKGKKFVINPRKGMGGGAVYISFWLDNSLESIAFDIKCTAKQKTWACDIVPLAEKEDGAIDEYMTNLKKSGVPIELVPPDLSFQTFWDAYGIKQNRHRAEKIWKKMSDADKVKALLHIPKLKAYRLKMGYGPLHADSYLRDKRYNDEY